MMVTINAESQALAAHAVALSVDAPKPDGITIRLRQFDTAARRQWNLDAATSGHRSYEGGRFTSVRSLTRWKARHG